MKNIDVIEVILGECYKLANTMDKYSEVAQDSTTKTFCQTSAAKLAENLEVLTGLLLDTTN